MFIRVFKIKMCGLSRAGRATCQTGLDNMLNMKRLKGRWKYKKTWTRKPQTVHYFINRCTYTECSGTTPKVGNLFCTTTHSQNELEKKLTFGWVFFFIDYFYFKHVRPLLNSLLFLGTKRPVLFVQELSGASPPTTKTRNSPSQPNIIRDIPIGGFI